MTREDAYLKGCQAYEQGRAPDENDFDYDLEFGLWEAWVEGFEDTYIIMEHK